MYFMISAIVGIPGSFIGGFLADRLGRKKVMIFFQSLAALGFASCAFLGFSMMVPWMLILSSFFGSASQPANSAMVADLTNEENRKRAFSLLYLGINVGFSVGPLIAGFLYNNYIKWIFLGDAITTLLSLLLVMIYVEESKPSEDKMIESKNTDSDERAEEGSLLKVLIRRPGLLAFTFIFTLYGFVYVQHSYSIPLQLSKLFGEEKAGSMFGIIMASNGIIVLLFTTIVTSLTVKIKPVINIAISGVLFGLGFGATYFANNYIYIWGLTFLWTIGEILETTNAGVYIANHTPMSHRGRFNSILPIIMGSGFAVGPYLTGGYIERFGVKMVWPATFIIAILASLGMYGLYLGEKKKDIKNINNNIQKA